MIHKDTTGMVLGKEKDIILLFGFWSFFDDKILKKKAT